MNPSSDRNPPAVHILLIVLITLCLGSFSLVRNPHNTDWSRGELTHVIAYNLYTTGAPFGGTPYVARPPGYIYFMTAVYAVVDFVRPETFPDKTNHIRPRDAAVLLTAVFTAQIMVLVLSALLLYLWAGCFMPVNMALFIALCFGSSGYWIVQAGTIHYAVLHIFFTLLAGYSLTKALGPVIRKSRVCLSGLMWGVTSLVRPVTLILPAFIIPITGMLYRGKRRKFIIFNLLFILGMGLIIGPYTIRNYRLTGRMIPVNAQAGAALWAATKPHPGINPGEYFWPRLLPEFSRIFREVTGEEYTYAGYIKHNILLDDYFKEEANRNFRKAPAIYFKNVFINGHNFAWGFDSAVVSGYIHHQNDRANPSGSGIVEGRWNSERSVRNVFMLMMWLLTALTLLALTRAIRRREKTLLVPAAVLACYGVGHAISYLDINYYYFKQPFLYLFAGYALSGLWYPERKLPVALRFIGGIIGGTWVVLTVILYGMLVSF